MIFKGACELLWTLDSSFIKGEIKLYLLALRVCIPNQGPLIFQAKAQRHQKFHSCCCSLMPFSLLRKICKGQEELKLDLSLKPGFVSLGKLFNLSELVS